MDIQSPPAPDHAAGEPPVFERLGALADATRSRLLALLEGNEFTVSELRRILGLPQSSVSRHLRVLTEGGWVTSRADGTSRPYRIASLDPEARALWRVVREATEASPPHREDRERAREVLAGRRDRSREFFASAAGRWDALRGELFGARSELLPLLGLLEPDWVVGDLGTGTGQAAAAVAPFVRRVVAVDRSREMLEAAGERLREVDGVELREGELESLPVDDGELDVALLLLVLPYVIDPGAVLAEARRALSPGGRLLLVDMRLHAREGYREEMGHLWPGFEEEPVVEWLEGAGFERCRWRPLPPLPEAEGPLLFAASGRA